MPCRAPLRTSQATRSAAVHGSSCSHIRTTVHPASRRRLFVSRSRLRFARIFSAHHCLLVRGARWSLTQPCQKQPSTNTAKRALTKTTSARRRTPRSGAWSTRYRRPRRLSSPRRASSAAVSRRRTAFMRADVVSSIPCFTLTAQILHMSTRTCRIGATLRVAIGCTAGNPARGVARTRWLPRLGAAAQDVLPDKARRGR